MVDTFLDEAGCDFDEYLFVENDKVIKVIEHEDVE
jgi:hypothetical protein